MDDRLAALRALRAEVLDTAEGPMPKNTARVLMQTMNEVVRARAIRCDSWSWSTISASRPLANPVRCAKSCATPVCWRCPKPGPDHL